MSREGLFWTYPVKSNGEAEDPSIPDLDDFIKAAQDSLLGTVLANDVTVCKIIARKVYGRMPLS